MPLHEAIFLEPGVAGAKYGLSLLGRCRDEVRSPLLPLTPATRTAIRAAMVHAGPPQLTPDPGQLARAVDSGRVRVAKYIASLCAGLTADLRKSAESWQVPAYVPRGERRPTLKFSGRGTGAVFCGRDGDIHRVSRT